MSQQRRLLMWFLILVGILVAAMARTCNSNRGAAVVEPQTKVTRVAAARPGSSSRRRDAGSVDVVEALFSLEAAKIPADYKAGRNPFSFYEPPPPPPKPQPKPKPIPKPEPRPVDLGPIIPPAPQPPMFRLQYLGSFGPERMKIAVFTDGEAIFNVSTGETIEEEFVVRSIGLETVSIGYVDFPDVPPKQVPVGQ